MESDLNGMRGGTPFTGTEEYTALERAGEVLDGVE